MKKVKLFLMGLLLNVFAFAYNPPVGSQAMFNLSSPTLKIPLPAAEDA